MDALLGEIARLTRVEEELTVVATDDNGNVTTFKVNARIDTPVEVEYYRNGGILQTVLRKMARGEM